MADELSREELIEELARIDGELLFVERGENHELASFEKRMIRQAAAMLLEDGPKVEACAVMDEMFEVHLAAMGMGEHRHFTAVVEPWGALGHRTASESSSEDAINAAAAKLPTSDS